MACVFCAEHQSRWKRDCCTPQVMGVDGVEASGGGEGVVVGAGLVVVVKGRTVGNLCETCRRWASWVGGEFRRESRRRLREWHRRA